MKTFLLDVTVKIAVRAEDEEQARRVVDETDYSFSHPDVASTEIVAYDNVREARA